MSSKSDDKKEKELPKKQYQSPRIQSEKLTALAALCNGTISGQRKADTGSPNFCNATKLLS